MHPMTDQNIGDVALCMQMTDQSLGRAVEAFHQVWGDTMAGVGCFVPATLSLLKLRLCCPLLHPSASLIAELRTDIPSLPQIPFLHASSMLKVMIMIFEE